MAPLIILMYALFASSFTMGKVLVGYAPPIFLTGIRMFIAGSVLLIYQYFWVGVRRKISPSHFFLYAQIIILGIYAAYGLRFWGLKYLSSSKTAFLYNASPFFSAIYSYIFFDEHMSRRQWLGLIIGFLGLIPILISTSGSEQQVGELFLISWPELVVLLSVALHSYSWIVVRKLVRYKDQPPMFVNSITMLIGGALALITSPIIETRPPIHDMSKFLLVLAAVIIVSNIICHNIYGYLLTRFSATFISFAGFQVPIFAALYGWSFMNETISWHFYVSTMIVFLGLYLFYKDELKKTAQWA